MVKSIIPNQLEQKIKQLWPEKQKGIETDVVYCDILSHKEMSQMEIQAISA